MEHSYSSDPIAEAIVQFRFDDFSENMTDVILPGKMHELISDEYDGDISEENALTTQVQLDESSQSLSTKAARRRVTFQTEDRKSYVSIGTGSVSIGVYKPYCGWPEFRNKISKALKAYVSLKPSSALDLVSLRYINVINGGQIEELSSYLKEFQRYENIQESRIGSFFNRTERLFADGSKMIVHQLIQRPEDENELVLDIDLMLPAPECEGINDMVKAAEFLHEREKLAFEQLITDDARDLFNAI